MSKISFNNAGSPFYKSLKKKVNNYFEKNQLSRKGGTKLFFKGLLIITSAITIYSLLVFFTPSAPVAVILCVLLGANMAAIGFNLVHEGGHESFSKYKWLNNISAHSLALLGGIIYFWKQDHNIDHHTYTNIEGMDHDISIPFMRTHNEQPHYGYHKLQHIYWVVLYGVSYLAWMLFDDFSKYFSGNMTKRDCKLDKKEHLKFWLTKVIYLFLFIIFPIIVVGWLKALTGFMIAGMVCGLCLSIFQLAHIVEGPQFPEPDMLTKKIENEWAVHQVNTSANFATDNKIISWFVGGLNFQVEHHLFPGISHIHYPQINKLVKETCEEFNVVYHEHCTISSAFYSHLMHIKTMGKRF